LTIEDRDLPKRDVLWTPRIGIRVGTEHEWRCVAAGSLAATRGPARRMVKE